MLLKLLVVFLVFSKSSAIYPYFDTQDFIYNIPKVYRITLTLNKLYDYYEEKPSKDPEFYIALGLARGQLEYTINELDKSVPAKVKEALTNITKKMDKIRSKMNIDELKYRSPDYAYVAKAMLKNVDIYASMLEPIIVGALGTQKSYTITFEQYVKEARNGMPTRKAADACTMQMLISAMESQTSQSDGTCEMTPICRKEVLEGTALAFQMTSRLRVAQLSRHFDCLEKLDLEAHIYKLCLHIYKEAASLEAWDHPPGTRTLFMQQILYCGSHGYGEFIKPRWMNRIISWQDPSGCYSDDRMTFYRLTGFVSVNPITEGAPDKEKDEKYKLKKMASSTVAPCNSLASAMALGTLTLHTRALLETDTAFQYDIME